ncbi:MAG: YdcF family protein [Proteobacteria bacterium]|nr:YdcF family protein [Pseudomonadota bacterium]
MLRMIAINMILLLLLWLGGFIVFITFLPEEPQGTEASPLVRTDAIVVLTGGSERLMRGIDLLKQDRAPVLFVSGVGKGVKVAELFNQVDFGDPDMKILEPRILLGHDANSTRTNAIEVKHWVHREHVKSIRLVTSNYHMFRSLAEIKSEVPELTIVPHPVTPMNVIHSEWWRFPNTAVLLFTEYNKFLIVSVRIWANRNP